MPHIDDTKVSERLIIVYAHSRLKQGNRIKIKNS